MIHSDVECLCNAHPLEQLPVYSSSVPFAGPVVLIKNRSIYFFLLKCEIRVEKYASKTGV